MSDAPDPSDEQPQTPRIVTNDGTTLTFDRVWLRKDGWACGAMKDTQRLRRYPPHRVKVVVEEL
jgi:hypothetical protein